MASIVDPPSDGKIEASLCGAESHWPRVTCQKPAHHPTDRHDAEDRYSTYTWTTASVQAERDGRCPGCLRSVCVCPCQCDMCLAAN